MVHAVLVESITILLLPVLSLMVIDSLPDVSSRMTVWPLLEVPRSFCTLFVVEDDQVTGPRFEHAWLTLPRPLLRCFLGRLVGAAPQAR